jgi:hypothetical protein
MNILYCISWLVFEKISVVSILCISIKIISTHKSKLILDHVSALWPVLQIRDKYKDL